MNAPALKKQFLTADEVEANPLLPNFRAPRRNHTVERIRAITDNLGGIWRELDGKPVGENLRCPLCGQHKMKIKLGDKTPVATPVVFCTGCQEEQRSSDQRHTEGDRHLARPPTAPSVATGGSGSDAPVARL